MSASGAQPAHFLFRPDESAPAGNGPGVWVLDLDAFLTSPSAEPPAQASGEASACSGPRQQACRSLITSIIARYLHIAPEELLLRNDAHGRLSLEANNMRCPAAAGVDFNIAHCENICVLGIYRNGRIGVDVEILRTGAKLSAVWNYLSPMERWRIKTLPPDDRPLALYKCWTAKEAFVKAVGLGLPFGLDQVETATTPDGAVHLSRIKGSTQLARGWTLVHRILDIAGAEAVAAIVFGRYRSSEK